MTTNGNRIAPYQEQSGKGPALAEHHPRLRGLLALCLCFCLTLGLLPTPALAADPTDNWTDASNYDDSWYNSGKNEFILTTAEEFAGLAKIANDGTSNFAGKTIKLGNDINLSAHLWVPIGQCKVTNDTSPEGGPVINPLNGFAGTFDGGGHTIKGAIIKDSDNNNSVSTLFGVVNATGSVRNLNLENATVEKTQGGSSLHLWASLLVGYLASGATVYNCSASGSLAASCSCSRLQYVAGLVLENNGTVKNSSVHVTSVSGNYDSSSTSVSMGGIFAKGTGSAENCFAVVDNDNLAIASGATQKKYGIGPDASYSYWADSSAWANSNVTPTGTECSSVTAEQIAGTSGTPVGNGTYNSTNSVVTALNNWVAANSDASYGEWVLKGETPSLAQFFPSYIDITTVPDQTKEGTAGQVNADVKLEGQVQENVELISVTLPASIPFIMDVDAAGALQRVLSATATLTNRSDVGVTITLTDVVDNDPTPLLDKADFVLVPDPDPTGNPVPLTAGTGKTDVLAILAAPADGVPTTSLLKVDGAARADVASVGSDGDSFTIGLTLKVNKTT